MLYKALGFFIWKTVKFYIGQKTPGRGKLALGTAVIAAAVAVGARAKRQLGSGSASS